MDKIATASAPGKVILFGEHAVVYGRPAIAVPVTQIQATATVRAGDHGLTIHARDLDRTLLVDPADWSEPLAVAVLSTLRHLAVGFEHALSIRIDSTIPLGSGFGSSAAVSAALVRAIGAYFGARLSPQDVSRLVYETEVLHHGTPSGIDNTVVAHAQPVYFVRDQTMERFAVDRPIHLVIADTGITTPTRETVGDVRAAWQRDRATYEALFDEIAEIVAAARAAIARGDLAEVGRLMNENHTRLCRLDVSSPELDHLVRVARQAGAWGAKMSGGGRGGNVVAIAAPELASRVAATAREAGAVKVIQTVVE